MTQAMTQAPAWQISQVFPPELLRAVAATVESAPLKYGWASNKKVGYTHWNHDFAHRGADNGLDCSQELPETMRIAWEYLQQQYLGPQTLLRCYTNAHTYGIEGNPHTDSVRDCDYTIVIYMNKEWLREWGGETMVYKGNTIVHAELPHYNNALVFRGQDWHCARSLTRICPDLRRTLMFKFAAPNVDPVRDRVQTFLETVGADQIKHSGRNLRRHLLNTYDHLKYTLAADPTTAAAGAMHSIFGTNVFKTVTVPAQQRAAVAATIGEAATELVELFRDIERPQTLETALATNSTCVTLRDGSTRTITPDQLNSLCAIEVANLRDQNSLGRWPHLTAFQRTRTKKCQ